jgi:hypothetical protein
MAYSNIEQLFVEHSMLIRNNVAKNIQSSDFYLKNLPKEQWLDGAGEQYQYPIYERSLSTTPVTFTDFVSSPGDGDDATLDGSNGGACVTAGQNIDSFGVTLRTTGLKKAALNSPDICLDDLRFAWQVEDQVKNMIRVLSENTKWVWTNTYQDEYIAAAGSKIVAAPNLPTGTSSFPLTPATSKLTWGILESVYEQLGYNGGGINPFKRVDDMTPIYAAVGERFTFSDLKKQDSNTRDDFRYAYQGSEVDSPMLQAPGLNGIYRGFQFFTVEFAPRYDFVGGAWVRRQPYSSLPATRGKKWEVSDEYKNAQFTDTVIYHADVLKVLIPKPQSLGGGLKYNPQFSWTGEFVWRNVPDRTTNIDGNIGFFRALYAYGPKIERPDLGFVIRHRRCQRALDLVACY